MDDRMMKAVLFDRYGGPDVLYSGRVPRPEPAPGEVLGRIRLLTGRRFPQRVGLDFTGEVAGLGAGVTRIAVGDRVCVGLGRTGFGNAAEYVAAHGHHRVRPASAGCGSSAETRGEATSTTSRAMWPRGS